LILGIKKKGREDFELAQYAASNLNARNVEQARWRLLEADVSPPECGKSALVGGTRPVEDVGIGTIISIIKTRLALSPKCSLDFFGIL